MGSTHCNFWKKIIRVRVTHEGRYLLKKDKIEGHRNVSDIEEHRIFFICSNQTCVFTIKSFDAT